MIATGPFDRDEVLAESMKTKPNHRQNDEAQAKAIDESMSNSGGGFLQRQWVPIQRAIHLKTRSFDRDGGLAGTIKTKPKP